MATLHAGLLTLHILFGSMALILFWVPLLSLKGGYDHVTYGRHYCRVMYLVIASGALMAMLVMAFPVQVKPQLLAHSDNLNRSLLSIRIFWSMLLYLSLLTLACVRHGSLVIKHRQHQPAMRDASHLAILILLLLGGLGCCLIGVLYSARLSVIFGLLGMFLATNMLRFCLTREVSQWQWVRQHISAFIGSGISIYTAFLAFGARSLTDSSGSYQLLFWLAPGVIGGIASWLLSHKYVSKYRMSVG